MIIKKSCEYGKKNELLRKKLKKQGFISSVEISSNLDFYEFYKYPHIKQEKLFKEIKKYCEKSHKYDCVRLNIDGTIKYWYKENQVKELIRIVKKSNNSLLI